MDADSEVPTVAAIQAEGFVEPWPLLGQLQLNNFKAEVLDVLRKKMRGADDDRHDTTGLSPTPFNNLASVLRCWWWRTHKQARSAAWWNCPWKATPMC